MPLVKEWLCRIASNLDSHCVYTLLVSRSSQGLMVVNVGIVVTLLTGMKNSHKVYIHKFFLSMYELILNLCFISL